MNRLANIAQSATPGTGIQFRKQPYGTNGVGSFLRDVLAMANASVDGPRFIVIGTDIDNRGRKRVHPVNEKDFSGKPAYQSLANEYIEPPLQLRYKPVSLDGKQVGVFEIGDCRDRPYMMRIDYSESLRRGDAYMRIKDAAIKMGRRQLQTLFERKFHDSVSSRDIEVGFAGEIIHKSLTLPSCDLSRLPSAVAASKLEQLVKIQLNSKGSGSTSVMERLVHAQLYGSDDPYVSRTPDELMQELEQIRHKYHDHDRHFLFEKNCEEVQLVIYNQGRESIVDAAITLVLPKNDDLYIADQLPKVQRKEKFVSRSPDDMTSYPSVSFLGESIHVTSKIGNVPVGEPLEVFGTPIRICLGPGLKGHRFSVRYALQGQNLKSPAEGILRLNIEG